MWILFLEYMPCLTLVITVCLKIRYSNAWAKAIIDRKPEDS